MSRSSMGGPVFGFSGGHRDTGPEGHLQGPEAGEAPQIRKTAVTRVTANWLIAAVQMGLIYVNPEGPDGNADPVASGQTCAKPLGAWR